MANRQTDKSGVQDRLLAAVCVLLSPLMGLSRRARRKYLGYNSALHIVSDTAKAKAIQGIIRWTFVQGAEILQDKEGLTLYIYTDQINSEEYAKKLSEAFVRLVKTYSEDENPQDEIGTGIYDYLVAVDSQKGVVLAFKHADTPNMTYE